MSVLNCPQCKEKLGEIPQHLLVDQFENFCENCNEFVEISVVRQIQQNQSKTEVSFGKTDK